MRDVLLLGAGSNHVLRALTPLSHIEPKLTTLDIEPRHRPDVVWDLNVVPWSRPRWWWFDKPFADDSFDEIHAYEVLEHLGQQGDAVSFFAHFGEIYRLLKPGGLLCGSCPRHDSLWAFGDPSHRRIINLGSFTFLSQPAYADVGKTAMTDFRSLWAGDFEAVGLEETPDQLYFMLKAHKPARRI